MYDATHFSSTATKASTARVALLAVSEKSNAGLSPPSLTSIAVLPETKFEYWINNSLSCFRHLWFGIISNINQLGSRYVYHRYDLSHTIYYLTTGLVCYLFLDLISVLEISSRNIPSGISLNMSSNPTGMGTFSIF